MASAELVSKEKNLNQFDTARREIRDKFARAHYLLQEREAVLLAEVQELEDKFHGREIDDEIEQLSLSKEQLENTLKGNKVQEFLQQSIAQIDEKISQLKIQREKAQEMEKVDFEWNEDLESKLNTLGTISVNSEKKSSKLISEYKKKGVPLAVFGKHDGTKISEEPGIFANPESVTMDVETHLFYICDYGNARVQVFDKMFQFLFMFSEKMDGPCGICVLQEKVYVTQFGTNCLNSYSLQGKLLNSVGKEGNRELEFKDPRGVAVSTEWRRIYICESGNNRVQCLNLDLSFNCFISNILYAKDVKLTAVEIVVLCGENPSIRIYNASHQLSRQIISSGEDSANQVWAANRFLLDSDLNIILTDRYRHCVCIFSYTGALIHKFGKEGEEKGEFIQPIGITLDSEGRIVVISRNPKHCIQLF